MCEFLDNPKLKPCRDGGFKNWNCIQVAKRESVCVVRVTDTALGPACQSRRSSWQTAPCAFFTVMWRSCGPRLLLTLPRKTQTTGTDTGAQRSGLVTTTHHSKITFPAKTIVINTAQLCAIPFFPPAVKLMSGQEINLGVNLHLDFTHSYCCSFLGQSYCVLLHQ